jgi:hypothetical protein
MQSTFTMPGHAVAGVYILFVDGLEIEINERDYQNINEIWDVLCEKIG